MKCKRCGKALSSEQATCPFCGAFLSNDQINEYVEMKKEKEKDLRPKLISEKYGMEPIKYEIRRSKMNSRLIVLLAICGFLVLLFLIVLFIFL